MTLQALRGRELDDVWDPWLFTAGKPTLPEAEGVTARTAVPGASWVDEMGERLSVGRY